MLFWPQSCLSDLVLTISALPACTVGKVHDQANLRKLSTYRDTVSEVKWYVSGENGSVLWDRGLNYSMYKLSVFFVCLFVFGGREVVPADQHLPYCCQKKKKMLCPFCWLEACKPATPQNGKRGQVEREEERDRDRVRREDKTCRERLSGE